MSFSSSRGAALLRIARSEKDGSNGEDRDAPCRFMVAIVLQVQNCGQGTVREAPVSLRLHLNSSCRLISCEPAVAG
jgi:hypothetical protein